jgi:hypothetical protein
VLEAAFQVHAALAQKRFARLALYGASGAIKDFSQRGGQSFFATPGTVGVPDHRANGELLDLGNLLDGKVAFVRSERAHDTILLALATMRLTTFTAHVIGCCHSIATHRRPYNTLLL